MNKQNLQFGSIPSYDRKDFTLTIKNKNPDLPIDFNFSKVAQFRAEPNRGKLMPSTKHTINLSFEPKNLGVFNNTMELSLLKGLYKIPLKLLGSCDELGAKNKGRRGPGATKEDFMPDRKFISEDAEMAPNKRKTKRGDPNMPKFLQESTTLQMDSTLKLDNTEKLDQYLVSKQNRERFNEVIKQNRVKREKKKKIQMKMKRTT